MKYCVKRRLIIGLLFCVSVISTYAAGAKSSGDTSGESPNGVLKQLKLYTPPAGVGVLMVDIANSGVLSPYADTVEVVRWDNPDKLRAGIMDNSIDITFLPTYLGANLYNKGVPFRLLNVVTGGLLYVISRDSTIRTIDDLKGKTVLVPFKNDMPDLVLRSLLKKADMEIGQDITIEYVATPEIAAKMAILGKADTILLPEIAATKVTVMAMEKKNMRFSHVIDIQKEWGRIMQTDAYIPQAGVAVRQSFAEENPELVHALHDALHNSSRALLEDETRLEEMVEKLWKNQGPIFAESIHKWNMDVQDSGLVRSRLEYFFNILQDLNPAIIGGKLPDADFYYQ